MSVFAPTRLPHFPLPGRGWSIRRPREPIRSFATPSQQSGNIPNWAKTICHAEAPCALAWELKTSDTESRHKAAPTTGLMTPQSGGRVRCPQRTRADFAHRPLGIPLSGTPHPGMFSTIRKIRWVKSQPVHSSPTRAGLELHHELHRAFRHFPALLDMAGYRVGLGDRKVPHGSMGDRALAHPVRPGMDRRADPDFRCCCNSVAAHPFPLW